MEIEDKKLLAAWMGYWINFFSSIKIPHFKKGNSCVFFDDWNPDTNYHQFKELENHLLDGDGDFSDKYIQLIGGIILIDPVISKETAMIHGLTVSIEVKCKAILKIAKDSKYGI